MNKLPQISVVVPIYNAEKYVEETIKSVLAQTYENIEVIAIDDYSSDNSCAVVEALATIDHRVRLIKLKKNFGGPAHPRNVGVHESLGKYIAFLDADDLWDKEKLLTQYLFMEEHSLNFSSTALASIDQKNNLIEKSIFFRRFKSFFFKKQTLCDLIKGRFIATSSVMILKTMLDDFSEEKDFISVEDYFLWLHILNKEDVKYSFLNQKLLLYRILDDSISDRKNIYKQEVKASFATLKFILSKQKFEYFPCFIKGVLIQNIRKLLKK